MAPKHMTNEEIKIVVALHKEGKSARAIAKCVGRSSRSIDMWLKRFKESPAGETLLRKKNPGKPRKTSRSTDKLLKRAVLKDPTISARQLKFQHPELLQDVSIRTIQHRLQKDLKMPSRQAAIKPLLTEEIFVNCEDTKFSTPRIGLKGNHKPTDKSKFMSTWMRKESMPHSKEEIETEEYYGDCEDTEFSMSKIGLKVNHKLTDEPKPMFTMPHCKEEIKTEEYYGDCEGTEFSTSTIGFNVKHKLSDESRPMSTWMSKESMPQFKEEIKAKEEFFDNSEDTEFSLSKIGFKVKHELTDEFRPMSTWMSKESMPHCKEEIKTEEFYGDCEGTEFSTSTIGFKVKHELSDESRPMSTWMSKESMPQFKEEIKAKEEFFDNSEDTEFSMSKIGLKVKHELTDEPMPHCKEEIKTEEFYGDCEDTEFSTSRIGFKVKHELTDESNPMSTWMSKESMPKFREEIKVKVEFFDNSEDTEFSTSRIGFKVKHELTDESNPMSTWMSKESMPKFKEEIKVKEEFFDNSEDTEIFTSKIERSKLPWEIQHSPMLENLTDRTGNASDGHSINSSNKLLPKPSVLGDDNSVGGNGYCDYVALSSANNSKSFKCNDCGMSFTCEIVLKRHVFIHKNMNPFKCSYCNYSCRLKKNLYNHCNSVHKIINSFKCSYCNFSCGVKGSLTRHIKNIHEKLKIYCPHCEKAFPKSYLPFHIKSVHEKPFKCSFCDFAANKINNLINHIKVVHENMKKFKCSFCDFAASQNSDLINHIKSVHNVS